MNNLFKKSNLIYKIISVVLSIVMIVSTVFIHLDKRYQAKAIDDGSDIVVSDEQMKNILDFNCKITSNGTDINISNQTVTKVLVGTVPNFKFAKVYTLDAPSGITNNSGMNLKQIELSYTDAYGIAVDFDNIFNFTTEYDAENPAVIKVFATFVFEDDSKIDNVNVINLEYKKLVIDNLTCKFMNGDADANDGVYNSANIKLVSAGYSEPAITGTNISAVMMGKLEYAVHEYNNSDSYDSYQDLEWKENLTTADYKDGKYVGFVRYVEKGDKSIVRFHNANGAIVNVDDSAPKISSLKVKKQDKLYINLNENEFEKRITDDDLIEITVADNSAVKVELKNSLDSNVKMNVDGNNGTYSAKIKDLFIKESGKYVLKYDTLYVTDAAGNPMQKNLEEILINDDDSPIINRILVNSNEVTNPITAKSNSIIAFEIFEDNFDRLETNIDGEKVILSKDGFNIQDLFPGALSYASEDFDFVVYDKAGNSCVKKCTITLDDEKPELLQNSSVEIKAKNLEYDEKSFYVNPMDGNFEVEFKMKVNDLDVEKSHLILENKNTNVKQYGAISLKDNNYIATFEFLDTDGAPFDTNVEYFLYAEFFDKVGNSNILKSSISEKSIIIINPKISISDLALFDANGVIDNYNYYNAKYSGNYVASNSIRKIGFRVSSGYSITSVKLFTNNGEYKNGDPQITEKITKNGYKSEYVTFLLPGTTDNILFSSMYIEVSDDRSTDEKQKFYLKDILFDYTNLGIDVGEYPTEWSKDYDGIENIPFEVKIKQVGSLDNDKPESKIKSVSYQIVNNGKIVASRILGEDSDGIEFPVEGSVEFTIDVPESKSIEGTLVKISAFDEAGNTLDLAKSQYVVKFDKTAPTISKLKINAKTDNGIVSGNPTLACTLEDAVCVSECTISIYDKKQGKVVASNTFENVQKEFSVKLNDVIKASKIDKLPDGEYSFTVNAKDLAGHEAAEQKLDFSYDNSKPKFSLSYAKDKGLKYGKNIYFNKNVDFVLTVDEANFIADEIVINDKYDDNSDGKLDDHSVKNDTSMWKSSKDGRVHTYDFDLSINAKHKIEITGVDKAGNPGDKVSETIVIDTKMPKLELVEINDSDEYKNAIAGDPKISITADDQFYLKSCKLLIVTPSGKQGFYEFKESNSVEGIPITYEKVLSKINGIKTKNGKLEDGTYRIGVELTDVAGNVNKIDPNGDDAKIFKLDSTPPNFNISVASGNSAKKNTYYNTDVNVEFEAIEKNFDSNQVHTFDNDMQISPKWSGKKGKYKANQVSSTEGFHMVIIKGSDVPGNKGKAKQMTFVIDKTKPVIDVVLNGGTIYRENMGMVNMSGPATVTATVKDAYVDNDDFSCQVIKAVPDQAVVNGDFVKTKERSFSFSEEAEYTVNFKAADLANNQSDMRSVKFRVDTTAPELSVSTGANQTATTATTVSFTMKEAFWKDANGKVDIYRKAGDGQAETLYKSIELKPTGQTTSVSEALSETGIYRFELEANDFVGHSSKLSQSFTLDTHKPVINISGVKDYDKLSKAIDFAATIEEEFYATKVVKVAGTRVDAEGKKHDIEFSYVPSAPITEIKNHFKDDGIYSISVEASDPAGNKDSKAVTFTIDASKPKINSAYLTKFKNSINKFDLTADAEDLVTDLTVCDVHLFLNGSEYDGKSDIEDGHYVLRLTAKDELGNSIDEEVADFTLDTKAPVIIVTGAEDGEVKNEAYSVNVSLQIAEDTLKSVKLNGQTMAITNNTCQINVDEKGKYVLEIDAIDEAGNKVNQVINFEYGNKSSALLIILIAAAAAVVVLGATAAILLKKKNS